MSFVGQVNQRTTDVVNYLQNASDFIPFFCLMYRTCASLRYRKIKVKGTNTCFPAYILCLFTLGGCLPSDDHQLEVIVYLEFY